MLSQPWRHDAVEADDDDDDDDDGGHDYLACNITSPCPKTRVQAFCAITTGVYLSDQILEWNAPSQCQMGSKHGGI